MDPIRAFKSLYSVCLLIFSITIIMGLIFTRQTRLSSEVHPALAFIMIWGAILWLSMVEGGQASLVGLAPVNKELYKESHPISYASTTITNKGDNLDRYLLGRQFMVVLVVFMVNLSGAPLPGSELWGFPKIITDIFLVTGFAMILFTTMVGQLNTQVNASHCMLDYINTYFAVFTLWVAMTIEFSGLLHASYLVQMLVAAAAGKPIESNEPPKTGGNLIFFWARCLMSLAILCGCLAVTLEALFSGKTTMWDGVPNIVALILFVILMCVVGMLEGMQIAFFAVAKLRVSERGDAKFAKMTCELLFKGKGRNMPGFMVGRQLCVVSCMFIVARVTSIKIPEGEENIFGAPEGLQNFFNTGLCGAIFLTIVGSISWQLVASAFPIAFLSTPITYILLRICLFLEATGICQGAWVLAAIHKKIAGFQRDEVYIGTAEERAAKKMADEDENLYLAKFLTMTKLKNIKQHPRRGSLGGFRSTKKVKRIFTNTITVILLLLIIIINLRVDFLLKRQSITTNPWLPAWNDIPASKITTNVSTTGLSLFNGSTITRISPAMDLYRNVCLQIGDFKRREKRWKDAILSYTMDGQPLSSSGLAQLTHPLIPWTVVTSPRPKNEWENHSSSVPLVSEDTVLVFEMYGGNIAHCLVDLVFSLALDMYHREESLSPLLSRNMSMMASATTTPFYAKFVHHHFPYSRITESYQAESSWCLEFLQTAGMIDVSGGEGMVGPSIDSAPIPTPVNSKNKNETKHRDEILPRVCFERLLVPSVAMHRFPLDWSDPFARRALRTDFVVRRENMWKFDNEPSYADRGGVLRRMYPQEALHMLRDRIFHSLGFTTAPWPQKLTDNMHHYKYNYQDRPILLYDRRGTTRRILENSNELKNQLERNYNVTVHLLGENWNDHNFTQQAELYHGYSRIVTVHGAHMANTFFLRPGSEVVEITCGKREPMPNINLTYDKWDEMISSAAAKAKAGGVSNSSSTASDTTHFGGLDPSQWYGQTGWFTAFTRRLGVEHFVIGEEMRGSGCGKDDGRFAKSFKVDTAKMTRFIASRFRLPKTQALREF